MKRYIEVSDNGFEAKGLQYTGDNLREMLDLVEAADNIVRYHLDKNKQGEREFELYEKISDTKSKCIATVRKNMYLLLVEQERANILLVGYASLVDKRVIMTNAGYYKEKRENDD